MLAFSLGTLPALISLGAISSFVKGVFQKLIVHQKIAEKIRRIRKERNISQEELAFKAGLNRAYVGYIERGERKPSVDTLAKLARALKVKLSEFLE